MVRRGLEAICLALAACSPIQVVRAPCGDMATLETSQRACVVDTVVTDVAAHFDVPGIDAAAWARRAREQSWAVLRAGTPAEFYDRLQEMVASLGEDHTALLPPPDEQLRHAFVPPINVRLVEDRAVALSAGDSVRPGDIVVSVDGRPLDAAIRMLLPRVSGRRPGARERTLKIAIGGAQGSPTTWRVRTGSEAEREVVLQRTVFWLGHPQPPRVEELPGGVLYVKIPNFGGDADAVDDVFTAAFERRPPPRALVIDVRGNPGGSNVVADAVLAHLLPEGTPLCEYHRGSDVQRTFARSSRILFTGPLTVLDDASTCSAAEAFAAVLKRTGRATIIGESTCGAAGVPHRRVLLPAGYVLHVSNGWVSCDGKLPLAPVVPDKAVSPTLQGARSGEWATPGDPRGDRPLATALSTMNRAGGR